YEDVINVPAGKTVVIRIQFEDFLGTMVYHCHRVDHEDMGMMSLVKIIPNQPTYAVGANAGQRPLVKVTNPVTGTFVSFLAFERRYHGGVNVAVADVNGDGVYDIIVGRAQGKSEVKIIDGTKLNQVNPVTGVILPSALLGDFLGFARGFHGGLFVAAGDINGDGLSDVILGSGSGPRGKVKVVNAAMLNQGGHNHTISPGPVLAFFRPFGPRFDGGVRVACGDYNGDGRYDIVAVQGPHGHSEIKIFDSMNLMTIGDLFPFGSFRGGVFVGTGNIQGFAFDNLIVGAGKGVP